MWKMVMGEYFKSFTWGNINENIKNTSLTLFPILVGVQQIIYGVFDSDKIVVFLLVILPLVFNSISTACFSAGLSKIMHLCPMNEGERKDYLNKKCMVKIGVSSIVSLISGITYLCMGGYPLYAVAMVLNHCALHICAACDTNTYGWGTRDVKGNYVIDEGSSRGLLEFFIRTVVYFIAVVQMGVCVEPGSLVGSLWMLGITLAIELPMVIWFVKHWPEYVEKELCYETTDRVCNWKGLVKK